MTGRRGWRPKPPLPQGNDMPLRKLPLQVALDRLEPLCPPDAMTGGTPVVIRAAFKDMEARHPDPMDATVAELAERITHHHEAAKAATDRSTK